MRGGFEWRLRVGRVARAAGWPGAGPAGVARRWRVSLDGLIRRHTYSCVADSSGACGWAGSRGRPVGLGLARPALPGVGECRWTASYELIRIHAWRFGCGWVAVVGGLGAWPAAVVRSADGPRRGDVAPRPWSGPRVADGGGGGPRGRYRKP